MKVKDLQQWLSTLNPDAEVRLKIWYQGWDDDIQIEALKAVPEPLIVAYLDDTRHTFFDK